MLVDRFCVCVEVMVELFGVDELSVVSVFDGFVCKVRYLGDVFVLFEVYDDGVSDGEEERLCGCADVTALSAFGSRASKEMFVVRVFIVFGFME